MMEELQINAKPVGMKVIRLKCLDVGKAADRRRTRLLWKVIGVTCLKVKESRQSAQTIGLTVPY